MIWTSPSNVSGDSESDINYNKSSSRSRQTQSQGYVHHVASRAIESKYVRCYLRLLLWSQVQG